MNTAVKLCGFGGSPVNEVKGRLRRPAAGRVISGRKTAARLSESIVLLVERRHHKLSSLNGSLHLYANDR